jgi:hypothetical protein
MFDFEEANKMLESEETEICLPSGSLLPISAQNAIDEIKGKIDIQPLVNQAEGYQIANVEQATQALSMALQARKLVTALIDSKKEITKPQLDFQRAVNKLVADYTEKLQAIENGLKDKIETWIDESTEQGFTSGLDSIQVPDGSLKRVTTWEFDVEDSSEIPFEYMTPDIEGINKAIKGGVRHIPGVKIYTKQEVKLRVKN